MITEDTILTRKQGARTRIEAAAVHEAGHAVAAACEARQLGRVIVRRDRPGSGFVYYSNGHSQNPYDPTASPGSALAAWEHTRTRLLSDLRIKLAGPVAEAKAHNRPLRAIGAYSDLNACERVAEQLETRWQALRPFAVLPSLNAIVLTNQQRAYVRRWIARPPVWACIRHLGEVLSRRGELQGHEVFEALGRLHKPQAQLALPASGLDSAGNAVPPAPLERIANARIAPPRGRSIQAAMAVHRRTDALAVAPPVSAAEAAPPGRYTADRSVHQ